MGYLPLEGVRILDLGILIPGALATRRLADMGADVVKVERPPGGDYLRVLPPHYEGVGFHHLVLNRGKRSVALDITRPDDQRTFLQLVAQADAIVEVSHPGRWAAAGIDFAKLRAEQPELVICSITGFGQTGPLADLPSHGLSMDAYAGCAFLRDDNGRWHFADGVLSALAVEAGANSAALAVTAAVFKARASGDGAWIDISCWDSAAEMNRAGLAYRYAMNAPRPNPMGDWTLYSIYKSADDKPVLLCAIEEKFFRRFCDGLGRPEWFAMWGGTTGTAGYGTLELRPLLDEVFASAPAAEWERRFIAWDVPGGLVLTPDELAYHPHMLAREMIDPNWSDTVPNVLSPIRWMEDGSRPGVGAAPCPVLGSNTDEVLAEWLDVPRKRGVSA